MDKIVNSILFALYQVLGIMQTFMFLRAILSWIPSTRGTKIYMFLYEITETIVRPVRKLIDKTSMGNSMIDFSFLITFILLIVLQDIIAVI
ncbi:MAG: YggT family protein [Clostridia bacterium]|nr:YggT family protein [Clostridia bacterium]